MTDNLYWASGLAILVLLFFLRSPSSLLIIGLSIPVSVITTFIVLDVLGRSLNIVMLAGLAFAVGNVVDNSIVVLENIFRHREMGKPRAQAALDGAIEVWSAILASTLTNLAVFLPIIFVKDEAGQLFRDIAIATSISTALSLLVALTIVPMMSARVLKVRTAHRRPGRWQRLLDILLLAWIGEAFSNGLMRLLTWLRRGMIRRLAMVAVMTLGSVALAWLFMPPIDYLPKGNRNLILSIVQVPPGYNLEQIQRLLIEIEGRYLKLPQIQRLFAVSRTENPLLGVVVKPEYADIHSMQQVVQELRKRSSGIPGTRSVFITQAALFRRRGQLLGGSNIEIDVKGSDLEAVRDIAATVERQTRALEGVNFVRSSFEWGNPELHINVDRGKAADLGLSVSEIGYLVETFIAGTEAGTFRERGKELDLMLIIDASGQAKDLDRTWGSLKWAFLLAMVITYLLMCSLYESFTYPFVILFSIPPAMVGGVLGLRILHTIEPTVKMDVIAMLGFIIMAGIVVNAAILLVEQALNHMRQGMAPQDAIIESARNRLRPIFMTASSLLGFLPLVMSSGAGSELYRNGA